MALSKVFMWSDVQSRIKSLVNKPTYSLLHSKREFTSPSPSDSPTLYKNNFQINMGNSQSADISEQEAASISKLTGFTKSQIQKIYHRLVVLVQLDLSLFSSLLRASKKPSQYPTLEK